MKIIIAPDSYKGSSNARDVGEMMGEAFEKEIVNSRIEIIPMADGGEGSLESLIYTDLAKKIEININDNGENIRTYIGELKEKKVAIIEISLINGFKLTNSNPLKINTRIVGKCVLKALDMGYRDFVFFLGGSSSNDGGTGMLEALGVEFFDDNNQKITPYPERLINIFKMKMDNIDERILESKITIASDVENPLYGENGATYIFGPQKGLSKVDLKRVDNGMKNYANVAEKAKNKKLNNIKGAGSAGGLGFSLLLLGGEVCSGAKYLAKALNIESKIQDADIVITGEGKTDYQTLQGKLPFMISRISKANDVPCILISGSINLDNHILLKHFTSVHSISNGPISHEKSVKNVDNLIYNCAQNIARLLKLSIT